jgi:uncharacterized protein YqeY
MTIQELRQMMMKAKKNDPEIAKVLTAILAQTQLIAKNDGNREVTSKDIISAVKKEVKMTQQSKEAGAPYSEITFKVAEYFLPKKMNKIETEITIETIITRLKNEGNKPNIGMIMKELNNNYKDMIDKKLASVIIKNLLN